MHKKWFVWSFNNFEHESCQAHNDYINAYKTKTKELNLTNNEEKRKKNNHLAVMLIKKRLLLFSLNYFT